MKHKIKKEMSIYMYDTEIEEITNENKELVNNKCQVLGYLDGYFNETVYRYCYFSDSECRDNYLRGLHSGRFSSKKINSELLKMEKRKYLQQLAAYDTIFGVQERNLSKKTNEEYQKYKKLCSEIIVGEEPEREKQKKKIRKK